MHNPSFLSPKSTTTPPVTDSHNNRHTTGNLSKNQEPIPTALQHHSSFETSSCMARHHVEAEVFLVAEVLLLGQVRVGVLLGLEAGLHLGLLLGLLAGVGLDVGLAGRVQVVELLRVGAEVAEQVAEVVRREQHLGEVGQPRVLLDQRLVLRSQKTRVVVPVRELALEPANVLCDGVSYGGGIRRVVMG